MRTCFSYRTRRSISSRSGGASSCSRSPRTSASLPGTRATTPAPLVRTGPFSWALFRPAVGHPLRAAIDGLHALQVAEEAAATRDLLVTKFPSLFVATATASSRDGHWRTHALWPPSEAALPEVDSIVVVDAHRHALRASFSDVRRLAGDLLRPVPGLRTPWWHATAEFPSEKLDE